MTFNFSLLDLLGYIVSFLIEPQAVISNKNISFIRSFFIFKLCASGGAEIARNDKITKLELTDDVGCHQRRSIKQESTTVQRARCPGAE